MALPLLPPDIIRTEILLRLPFKSLLRFRSVCKSWKSLFSEPDFINYQINDSTQNPDKYLIINPPSCDLAILSSSSLSETGLFDHVPKSSSSLAQGRMLGSINGLVCIFLLKLEHFIIWNPVIRQGKKITSPRPLTQHFCSSKVYFGFCWDELENDYQIVICFVDHSTTPRGICLYVYSCNSDSWSSLPDVSVPTISRPTSKVPSAIVNGVPYWKTKYGEGKVHLIKFDVRWKKFRELPKLDAAISSNHIFLVANWKDCISVLVYKPGYYSDCLVHVYGFDERCGIWSKMLSIGPVRSRVLSLATCFKYGGEILYVTTFGELICYYHKTNTEKLIKPINDGRWMLVEWFSYKPSLVVLQEMKPLHHLNPAIWKQPR